MLFVAGIPKVPVKRIAIATATHSDIETLRDVGPALHIENEDIAGGVCSSFGSRTAQVTGQCILFAFTYLVFNPYTSVVTYIRIGTDIAKVLVPGVLNLAIPVGFATSIYMYAQNKQYVA